MYNVTNQSAAECTNVLQRFLHVNLVIEIPVGGGGGSMYKPWCRFIHRAPLDLKSTGNGSIGIDLASEKDQVKKYFRIFENEFIKVEKKLDFR